MSKITNKENAFKFNIERPVSSTIESMMGMSIMEYCFGLTPYWEAEDKVDSNIHNVLATPEMTASHALRYCASSGEELLEDEAESIWAEDFEVLNMEAKLMGRRIRY
jgi:hypothetical protein